MSGFSSEYNYVLVGPGASGKSRLHGAAPNRVPKLDTLPPVSVFFKEPQGFVSYCSINFGIERLVNLVRGKPICVVICRCGMVALRRRLTDRLYKRIRKYRNDAHFREAMDIFVKNYTYDYDALVQCLTDAKIPYREVCTG